MKSVFYSECLWAIVVITSILFQPIPNRCSAQGNLDIQRIEGCNNSWNIEMLLNPCFNSTYGEKVAKEIQYEQLLFSPDGQFLAVTISQVTCGDPEQIWIVDLKKKRARLATERVVDRKVGIDILSVRWIESDTLSADIERVDWLDQGNNVSLNVRATIDTSLVVPLRGRQSSSYPYYYVLSTSPTGHFRIISAPDTTVLLDVVHNKVIRKLRTFQWSEIQWSPDERCFTFIKNQGHGSLSLDVGNVTGALRLSRIADGSWELEGSCLSPSGTAVAFPESNDVSIYDISENKVVKVIDTGSYPNLVAWGMDDQIVVSCRPCKQDEDTTRTSNGGALHSPRGLYLIGLR